MAASGARLGVRQGHLKSALDGGSWFDGASQGRDSYREVTKWHCRAPGPQPGTRPAGARLQPQSVLVGSNGP
jgi:hypothetical protein